MLPRSRSLRQSPAALPATDIGVGIDTSRYGHYAAFLDADPWPGVGDTTEATGAGGSRDEVQAAGHTPDEPAGSVVTATCAATVADAGPAVDGAGVWLDFAHLKRQLPLSRVLDHLGLTARLKGSGPQRRCACPMHRGDGRGRTFSVNLESNVYQCFDARCGSQGDVIDLWAALHQRDVRSAALDLVHIFGLEPCPAGGPEKRNG